MKILMVAAESMELPGILSRATGVRPVAIPLDWVRLAQLGPHEVLLAANGAGIRRAGRAVETALEHFSADAIVSTGFCGALDPALRIADVVVSTGVTGSTGHWDALHPASAPPHQKGVVCCIDHVAGSAAEKRDLRVSGASVVEMESAGVASRAAAHCVPFYCIRAVTDLAGEDMANDFNRALRQDGHFATMSILRGTLRNPWVRLPELVRLRNRCVRAARVLGDFIADCRF
jgi:adenosylhomocysteine nucleosidase